MGEISKELIDRVNKDEKTFWVIIFVVIILDYIMFRVFTTYLKNYLQIIYLIWGIIGTIFVGSSCNYSKKAIIGYASTKTDYNDDVVDMLSKSKLLTSIGTVFLLTSYLLGYMM